MSCISGTITPSSAPRGAATASGRAIGAITCPAPPAEGSTWAEQLQTWDETTETWAEIS